MVPGLTDENVMSHNLSLARQRRFQISWYHSAVHVGKGIQEVIIFIVAVITIINYYHYCHQIIIFVIVFIKVLLFSLYIFRYQFIPIITVQSSQLSICRKRYRLHLSIIAMLPKFPLWHFPVLGSSTHDVRAPKTTKCRRKYGGSTTVYLASLKAKQHSAASPTMGPRAPTEPEWVSPCGEHHLQRGSNPQRR